jgi:hypothetical protein
VCQHCSHSFKHSSSFYHHLRYECGAEPRFQCPICNMKFKQIQHDNSQETTQIWIQVLL